MKKIPLTQGKFALVDDANLEWLNQWKWYAGKNRASGIFYAKRSAKRGKILMHRAILNAKPKQEVDHRDGNSLNNCRDNLRFVTAGQNAMNRHRVVGVSRYKGVSRHRAKWRACIEKDKKGIHIGYFDLEIEAAKAYDLKAKELFGEFARPNFQF